MKPWNHSKLESGQPIGQTGQEEDDIEHEKSEEDPTNQYLATIDEDGRFSIVEGEVNPNKSFGKYNKVAFTNACNLEMNRIVNNVKLVPSPINEVP